ncbi:hypothetical protein [Bosea sp. RAC05]|uniref:hypothetical protein n=1 Tax=Bosea sp. RAC05 TaxID=1842539 RepID=UPI00083CF8AE|nr:hypothetical protein [Bosea sp. RAC05]AOG03323.1 hypothetical protein BSY19_5010 [Bosea sp. RAC05]
MSARRRSHLLLSAALIVVVSADQGFAQASSGRSSLNSEAGPVAMTEPAKTARDREIVTSLIPEAAAVGDVVIETALVDVESDRNAEVFARIRSKTTCDADGKRCRTVLARYSGNSWKVVLDRRSTGVAMASPGFGGMRSIVIDGRETWSWNGAVYALDVAASGQPVSFREAPAANRDLLVAQFGAAASRLSTKMPAKVMVGAVDPTGKGASLVVARLEGPGWCGVVLGCPTRVLQVKDGGYVSLMDGLTNGKVSVMSVTRDGWKDLVAEMPRSGSRVIYGWSGKQYGVAERIGLGVTR